MTPAIYALIIQLIELGVKITPQIIAAAQTEIRLIRSGQAPSAAQQAQIDAALDAAHAALQAG